MRCSAEVAWRPVTYAGARWRVSRAGRPRLGRGRPGCQAKVGWWMFQPPLSWSMVRVCCPAGKVTVAVTAVQVCQPPVAGTLMFPDKLAPEELAMGTHSFSPGGGASRKVTV